MILVTGSSGHLGEALMRTLGSNALGVDRVEGAFTQAVGDLADRDFVRSLARDHALTSVLHTATLHKPHVAHRTRQDFVDANVTATLNLLEETRGPLIFTSTTSAFGRALVSDTETTWITEDVAHVPKNIYGATKTAAEDLCQLTHQDTGRPCLVLRTSRFFPEDDDNPAQREAFDGENLKALELLHRRVDIADAVNAHLLALEHAESLGFTKLIISATTPFTESQRPRLKADVEAVLAEMYPQMRNVFAHAGWRCYDGIDRVYVNIKARRQLGWEPKHTFAYALDCVSKGKPFTSELARAVGAKGYGVPS